jgi:hypothetical protein
MRRAFLMDKTERNLTLSRKQLKSIPVIISAKTITEGVKQARISKTLFYEWMKTDTFRNEFISRQNDLIETALKELKGLSSEAVKSLGKLLRESENENIRLKAIALILDHTMKIKEFEDIEQRLTEIEKRMTNGNH